MEELSARPSKNKWTAKSKIIVGSLLAVLVLLVVIISNGPKAKYQVSDTEVTYENATTVSVSFKVKNIGSSPGQPSCQIDAHSPDHSYYGGDMVTLSDKINPGDTKTTAGPITINKQGAANITSADVNCS